MTRHVKILPPAPLDADDEDDDAPIDTLAFYGFAGEPSQRCDGWSAERQRAFLQAVSEGTSVTQACRIAGLTKQSAYAFRRSARGAGFALGWAAASLLAREALADELMERAMHGTAECFLDRKGEMVEHMRHDNRLAMAMLTRMDRMAEAERNAATHAAARMVAQDFDQYLALIGRDAGPARAGLFVSVRAEAACEADLAPLRALARADAWLRTHSDLAEPLATGDLDPACRAAWTAEQWSRAEAAGLVQLAPPPPPPPPAAPAPAGNGQKSQDFAEPDNPDDDPVWFDSVVQAWRTRFPPPEDFCGKEEGDYGEEGYMRELSVDEEEALEAPLRAEIAVRRVQEAAVRDAWFAGLAEAEGGAYGAAAAAPALAAPG